MRIKTDEKRQHIIDTAYRLFRANGFEKTSMSEVTAQVGGSKATLYNYFSSKEELFLECMISITDHYLEGILSNLKNQEVDVETALFDLAKRALRLIFAPEMLASRRLVIAEAERSGIGRLFHEKIISYQQEIALFLERAMEEGKLRKALHPRCAESPVGYCHRLADGQKCRDDISSGIRTEPQQNRSRENHHTTSLSKTSSQRLIAYGANGSMANVRNQGSGAVSGCLQMNVSCSV